MVFFFKKKIPNFFLSSVFNFFKKYIFNIIFLNFTSLFRLFESEFDSQPNGANRLIAYNYLSLRR